MNPSLELEGVVFTMYDARTNLSLQVVENVKQNLNERIYKTIIPRNVRLASGAQHGMPIKPVRQPFDRCRELPSAGSRGDRAGEKSCRQENNGEVKFRKDACRGRREVREEEGNVKENGAWQRTGSFFWK